jgi:hypothetical protein
MGGDMEGDGKQGEGKRERRQGRHGEDEEMRE